eukprot:CAMPEP_0205819526 /NCGR_PEP_ID=MMETSP0206-20130828/1953_1 /ASSEMBLY_ACC=CAM_ASM_000279 /TAXON_ID=36767 /ORGANISM="Euplotes focardii, Strain TN1" /LENGTH=76 /DNA_ID=CAMNT_0053113247 /DNA_START=39 /DNA_END=269 /DNA_ORIENTATION=+
MPECKVDLCDVVLIILAIFLPPLAVALKLCCCDLWGCANLILNIILCLFGWLPAIIHAWIVICFTNDTQVIVYSKK